MVSYYKVLRNGLQPLFVISKVAAVDVGSDSGRVLLGALVVATQVLGQLLAIVELDISHSILSDDSVGPKLLHEEHLIGEIRALCMTQERKRGKSESEGERVRGERVRERERERGERERGREREREILPSLAWLALLSQSVR